MRQIPRVLELSESTVKYEYIKEGSLLKSVKRTEQAQGIHNSGFGYYKELNSCQDRHRISEFTIK